MKIKKNSSIFKSVQIAAEGLVQAVSTEKSLQQILMTAILLVTGCLLLRSSYLEVLVVILSWILVLTFEIMNTALEKSLDYSSDREYHPLIKHAKDFAGASVLVISSFAWILSAFVIFKNFP